MAIYYCVNSICEMKTMCKKQKAKEKQKYIFHRSFFFSSNMALSPIDYDYYFICFTCAQIILFIIIMIPFDFSESSEYFLAEKLLFHDLSDKSVE